MADEIAQEQYGSEEFPTRKDREKFRFDPHIDDCKREVVNIAFLLGDIKYLNKSQTLRMDGVGRRLQLLKDAIDQLSSCFSDSQREDET